ncbi:hypothetical protein LINPERHAP1_LOCUS29131 [Linum perenne]
MWNTNRWTISVSPVACMVIRKGGCSDSTKADGVPTETQLTQTETHKVAEGIVGVG